jgi:HSP20 family protein
MRRIDRGFGRFERTLRVPARLNPKSVQADLHDGALTKRIPKPETVRPRRIEIRAETSGAHEGPQRQQEAATAS